MAGPGVVPPPAPMRAARPMTLAAIAAHATDAGMEPGPDPLRAVLQNSDWQA